MTENKPPKEEPFWIWIRRMRQERLAIQKQFKQERADANALALAKSFLDHEPQGLAEPGR